LRDHALLTRDNLGPNEEEAIRRAESLVEQLEGFPAEHAVWETVDAARELISFQHDLVRKATACQLTIHLHITGLQQMSKEAEDFLRSAGVVPVPSTGAGRILQLHQLWLLDAILHSDLLAGLLEPSERVAIEEFRRLESELRVLSDKAAHQAEVLGGGGDVQPAVIGLTGAIIRAVREHIEALERLKEGVARREVWVSAPPLILDHMIREERHYLEQLAKLTDRE
jgi:hypothetical protein